MHFRRSAEKAESLCAELKTRSVNAWALRADFSEEENIETLFAEALERCGRIDLLVNSASTFTWSTLRGVSWADFRSVMLVNAWAPLALSRAFRRCQDTGMGAGAIVNLLDSRITGGDPAHAGYILSKHLLAAITDMTATAFAPAIRVNAVAPGLMAGIDASDAPLPIERATTLPLRRSAHPREVADAVIYLLKSEGITGQVIYVDGGRYLRERVSECLPTPR